MGHMFRSEEMSLVQLYVQPETSYQIISELGELGCAQFRDLNVEVNSFQRRFAVDVKTCDNIETKLLSLKAEMQKQDVVIPNVMAEIPRAPLPKAIMHLKDHLDKTEKEIAELSDNVVKLKTQHQEKVEYLEVLNKTAQFFSGADNNSFVPEEIDTTNDANRLKISCVTGIINRDKVLSFERILWRISRGNVHVKFIEIDSASEDPATGRDILKSVFVVFVQGETLHNKLQKICDGFRMRIYNCPEIDAERQKVIAYSKTEIEDLLLILNKTKDHLIKALADAAKEFENWSIMITKAKSIYHTLNYFDMDTAKRILIGECWAPNSEIQNIKNILDKASVDCGSSSTSVLNTMQTKEEPPTYYQTNKFTQGFQNLIDSYGISSYREANPGLYTIVTFPFLFAVMFGDIGHALIMLAAALWLVLAEQKIAAMKNKGEIFSIFFSGRYIILLMSLFSLYTGFIYNDMFSKSLNIFGSKFTQNLDNETLLNENATDSVIPEMFYKGDPYFAGMDPVWQLAKNKIVFLNSFKMKLSIIFGVVHMIFGVSVSIINYVHFRKYSNIILDFLPQVLLLCFLFLYMVIMMFIKWIKYTSDPNDPITLRSPCAPSILIYFINMILFKGNTVKIKECEVFMYPGQETIQMVLVVAAFLCIPFMLLAKPFYIKYVVKKRPIEMQSEDEREPMSEIFIHQIIHTIEFVLSTISHTASYLRLWALSLAHAQLSEVLWTKLFNLGLTMFDSYMGGILIYVFFSVWCTFTVVILVVMEGLSAFLHTLRLHWVEFMSKFFSGTGYQFEPFSFQAILHKEEEE